MSAPARFNMTRLRLDLAELLAEARKQDCVEPCIPGPTDCSDEYRRGWLDALNDAYNRAAGLRAIVTKRRVQS